MRPFTITSDTNALEQEARSKSNEGQCMASARKQEDSFHSKWPVDRAFDACSDNTTGQVTSGKLQVTNDKKAYNEQGGKPMNILQILGKV